MTLRGPADADHYRVAVGRYRDRFYVDPLPGDDIADATDGQWPSVSTVKKGGNGQDWSFVALKRVAQAIVAGEDFQPGAQYGTIYDRLKSINQRGLEAAAQRGTNVHTYFERGLRGMPIEAFDPNEPGAEYVDAVRAFFDQYQPELIAAEVVAINRTLNGVGYGGTGDAIVKIEHDRRALCLWPDWKSRGEDSNHGAYPEEGAQIGGYALADYLIVEGPDGPKRILVPELDGGLIVSVKPDGCRIYPVDLKKAGEQWAELHRWWCARQHEREAIGKPWAPRKIAEACEATPSVARRHSRTAASPQQIAAPASVCAVEPPAGEVVTAVASPADRRGILLARYVGLCDDDRARFRRLAPDRNDLDAVEAALNEVDPFVYRPERIPDSTYASHNRGEMPPTLPTPTDEGEPVDDATFEALQGVFLDLPEDRRMWVHNVILEADQAAVPFRANKSIGKRTVRRYELYRGLITLAGADLADDELVRQLVATVLDSDAPWFPVFTVGQVVGSLGVAEAKHFAGLCNVAAKIPAQLDLRSRPAAV